MFKIAFMKLLFLDESMRKFLSLATKFKVYLIAGNVLIIIASTGAVVRNEDGPDSDLDLLVVFDEVERSEIIRLMGKVRRAIALPIPCDVIVTDLNEYDLKKNFNGSALYWPAHEGEIIYERIAS